MLDVRQQDKVPNLFLTSVAHNSKYSINPVYGKLFELHVEWIVCHIKNFVRCRKSHLCHI